MDRPQPAYEDTFETRTEVAETTSMVNVAFVKNLGGILKLCEIVLSIIVLICVACTSYWPYHASGGWVNFVAAFTLIICALFYLFYLFNIIRRLRGPWVIIEFSSLLLSAVLWFIAFIVSATTYYFGAGAVAAAVFGAVALAVYIAELVTRFRLSKQPNGFRITMTGVLTTNTPTLSPRTGVRSKDPGAQETRIGFQHGTTNVDYVMP